MTPGHLKVDRKEGRKPCKYLGANAPGRSQCKDPEAGSFKDKMGFERWYMGT